MVRPVNLCLRTRVSYNIGYENFNQKYICMCRNYFNIHNLQKQNVQLNILLCGFGTIFIKLMIEYFSNLCILHGFFKICHCRFVSDEIGISIIIGTYFVI